MEWQTIAARLMSMLHCETMKLSKEELEALIQTDIRATSTGCWWMIFQGKDLLTNLAEECLELRGELEIADAGKD